MIKRAWFAALSLALVLALVIGCASIISGSKKVVSIQSTPVNAKVTIVTDDGIQVASGNTPLRAKLERKHSYTVQISLDGYEDMFIQIDKRFNPVFLGNILCGGLIGIIVDLVTGAVYDLEPSEIMVTLQESSSAASSRELMLSLYMCDDEGQVTEYKVPMVKSLPEYAQ